MGRVSQINLVTAILDELSKQMPGVKPCQRELDSITHAANRIKAAFEATENTDFRRRNGVPYGTPGVTIRQYSNGVMGGYLCKGVSKGATHIELAVDKGAQQIRVKPGCTGLKLCGGGANSSPGGFSVSKYIGTAVLGPKDAHRFITLLPADDGWWIGSYKNEENV